MDNPLTPKRQDALIEDALHTYPIASMSRDITADVMSRIQRIPAPRPFRLLWTDIVLAIVFTLCLGALWFSVSNLPPIAMAQIRKQSILLYQHILVNARWLVPAIFFGVAGFLAALTIPYVRQELMRKSS